MGNYTCTPALALAVAIRVASKENRDWLDLPPEQKGGMKHSATAFLNAYFDLIREQPDVGPILHTEPRLARRALVGRTAFVIALVTDAAGATAAAPLGKLKKDQLPHAAIDLLPAGWLPPALRRSRAKKAKVTKAITAAPITEPESPEVAGAA